MGLRFALVAALEEELRTLLAALLPIDRLIAPDATNGVLDQYVVRGLSDEGVAAAKVDEELADIAAGDVREPVGPPAGEEDVPAPAVSEEGSPS